MGIYENLFNFILLIFLSSCSSYIEKFHRQFDSQQGIVPRTNSVNSPIGIKGRDRFDFYRNPREKDNPSQQVSVMRPKPKEHITLQDLGRRGTKPKTFMTMEVTVLWQSNSTSGFLLELILL